MFKYSISYVVIICFASIKAPETSRTSVWHHEFSTDWQCENICNDENKNRVADLCVKLSCRREEILKEYIRRNSKCKTMKVQLIHDTEGTFHYYEKTVGFCEMGLYQIQKKCITKSQESENLLVWDLEGETDAQYCTPKYEKKGWFASGGEF